MPLHSATEPAPRLDMFDNFQISTSDLERFVFPIQPFTIPAFTHPRSDGSYSSSEDFISLRSISSDFTNSCALRLTTRVSSESSSDRLSQFGTARNFHDIHMQNDMYWYNDEVDFTASSDRGPDFLAFPSEDKFAMASDTKHDGFQSLSTVNYSDKLCLNDNSSVEDVNKINLTECKRLNENTAIMEVFKHKLNSCTTHGCTVPTGNNNQLNDVEKDRTDCDPASKHGINIGFSQSPTRCSNNVLIKEFKSTSNLYGQVVENVLQSGENSIYDLDVRKDVSKEEEDSLMDELKICNTPPEDMYEIFDLKIIHRKNRTGFEETKDFPIVLNTMVASRYYITKYLGSAAFSKVVQAHDIHTGVDVCLKIIKNNKDFFDQSLDEIKLLKFVNMHDPADERHILRLYDYFYHQEHLFIVCELLRANLYEFQKFNQESVGRRTTTYFTLSRLQSITRQCLEALEYMHHLRIIHCDLKPENILIKSYRKCEIKVIDLGSSCFESDNLCLYVQSCSYRAPEVIIGLPYDQKIDIWSLGCILAELCTGEVLFPNDSLSMLLARVIAILGPIDLEMLARGQETYKFFTEEYDLYYINEETEQAEYLIPDVTSLEEHLQIYDVGFISLLRDLLEINPARRSTASEALNHPWLSHSYHF